VTGDGLAWALWPHEVSCALENPGIMPFTEGKPWVANSTHPLRQHWLDALGQSAWSGLWSDRKPLYRRAGSTSRAPRKERLAAPVDVTWSGAALPSLRILHVEGPKSNARSRFADQAVAARR
jgi:hypothetical protein